MGSEPPSSHRWNDTIALCPALSRQPSPGSSHPRPLYERRSSTFETPFARYQMYFSCTSFSDINYQLYPSLSCGARGDGGRSGQHTLSANPVCTRARFKKNLTVRPPASLFPSVKQVCGHLCMCSRCICLHGQKKRIYQRVSAAGVKSGQAVCLRPGGRLCLCVCVVSQIRKVKKNKNKSRKPKSLKQQSALTASTAKKKKARQTEEEANESETEEEEVGEDGEGEEVGGVFACGGGSRLMLPGILDVICVQL